MSKVRSSRRPILLLDVMGTLVTEPIDIDIPKFFGMSLAELMQVKSHVAWIEFEHGRIDEAQYAASFFDDGRTIDLAGLKAMLYDSYQWLSGTEELLAELKARDYEMHALSNYPTWYRIIEDKLRLSRYLEWTFVSCATGVRKPDPEAYLGPARVLSVAPSACLFVDDRKKNVLAAEAVGMPAILRTPEIAALRRALVARAIL